MAVATKRLYPVRDTALISLSVDLNYLEWSNFHPNLTLAICDVFALNVTIAKNGVADVTALSASFEAALPKGEPYKVAKLTLCWF